MGPGVVCVAGVGVGHPQFGEDVLLRLGQRQGMLALGTTVADFSLEAPLDLGDGSAVVSRQRLRRGLGIALERSQDAGHVAAEDMALGIHQIELPVTTGATEHYRAGLIGLPPTAHPIAQRDDAFVESGIIVPYLPDEGLGLVEVQIVRFIHVLVGVHLFLGVDGIHCFRVHAFVRIEDSGILADGRVDFRDAPRQGLVQAQVLVQGRLREEVVGVDVIVLRANAVHTPEALDQPHRVPVQVIVDDLVTVLQIQALGEHVGGDQRVDFGHTFQNALRSDGCVRIGLGREAGDDGVLVLVLAVDHLNVRCSVIGSQVVVEILGGVGVLGEDEHFAFPQRRAGQPRFEGLQLGILFRCDGLYQRQHLTEHVQIVFQVGAQRGDIEVGGVIALPDPRQGLQERPFFFDVGLMQPLLGILPGRDDAVVQGGEEGAVGLDHPLQGLAKSVDAGFEALEEHHAHQAAQVRPGALQFRVGLVPPFGRFYVMPQPIPRELQTLTVIPGA